jgi:hypothetical protein
MGAIVAVTDAVLRIAACDTPSTLCLHYSANASALNFDGPSELLLPFGVDMRHFRAESSMFLLVEASLAVVRSQCLDYFESIHRVLDDDRMLFKFERSMKLSSAEKKFMLQLCIQDGFEYDCLAEYWVNDRRAIFDLYPELRAFRDIAMLLKYMMAPSVEDLPQIHRWRPEDAELTWSFKTDKEGTTTFEVRAFDRAIKPSWPEDTYVICVFESEILSFFFSHFSPLLYMYFKHITFGNIGTPLVTKRKRNLVSSVVSHAPLQICSSPRTSHLALNVPWQTWPI